jgi:antitoxin Phd
MKQWQLQEAKARLSELIKSVGDEGPQEITVHGKPAAVVLSPGEYERLTDARPGFVAFLRGSPLVGVKLQATRPGGKTRPVRL